MNSAWKVTFAREAEKQYKKLKRSGLKPTIIDSVEFLLFDLELTGPVLKSWPNYGVVDMGKKESYHHCHLKRGHPTYVAC